MAWGDTHRVLRDLRRAGYATARVRDSTGRLAWDVFYPMIHHDFAANVNRVRNVYLGKVERYGSLQIGNYAPFGRPFFYVTHRPGVRNAGYTRRAIEVVRDRPRTTIRRQSRI